MLPYTATVYFSFVARYNEALWPWHLLVYVLALAMLALCLRPVRGGDRIIGALLAAAWLWVGVVFHYRFFATLNFAAPLYALLFVIQAVLVLVTAAGLGRIAFRFRHDVAGWLGLVVAIVALVGYPAMDVVAGFEWPGVRVPGLAPAPTVLFTVGIVTLATPRLPMYLLAVPLLWALIAGATAWALPMPQDYVLLPACLAALWLGVRARRAA
ncbi:DUF6064 family protein [Arhodomonas sp. AD133]|uniref:DUF6064 family protein n=1 Tax=Arhodomonas sp. AD133 TaxID=3415009 RepID=UPI003EB7AB53